MVFMSCAQVQKTAKPEPGYIMYDQVSKSTIMVEGTTYTDKFTYFPNGKLKSAITYKSAGGNIIYEHHRTFDTHRRMSLYKLTKITQTKNFTGDISIEREELQTLKYKYAGSPKHEKYAVDWVETGFNGHTPYVIDNKTFNKISDSLKPVKFRKNIKNMPGSFSLIAHEDGRNNPAQSQNSQLN